jgi:hypothetical protein
MCCNGEVWGAEPGAPDSILGFPGVLPPMTKLMGKGAAAARLGANGWN